MRSQSFGVVILVLIVLCRVSLSSDNLTNHIKASVRRFLLAGSSNATSFPSPTHPTTQSTKHTNGIVAPTKLNHASSSSPTMTSTISLVTSSSSSVTSSTAALTTPAFCQNRHSISCGFTFSIVCGSDGKVYATLCMLALGRCDDPALTQVAC